MATNLTPAEDKAAAEAKALADKEAEAKALADKEAEAKALADKARAEAEAKKYYVAEGKSICAKGGIIGQNKEVSVAHFNNDKKVFDDLIKRKFIVKRK